MRKTLGTLCFSYLLLSGAALADARQDEYFKIMDADQDGRLDPEEASPDRTILDHFSEADRNADGYLTKGEFAKFEVVVRQKGTAFAEMSKKNAIN